MNGADTCIARIRTKFVYRGCQLALGLRLFNMLSFVSPIKFRLFSVLWNDGFGGRQGMCSRVDASEGQVSKSGSNLMMASGRVS
jgi:hypothetical protein